MTPHVSRCPRSLSTFRTARTTPRHSETPPSTPTSQGTGTRLSGWTCGDRVTQTAYSRTSTCPSSNGTAWRFSAGWPRSLGAPARPGSSVSPGAASTACRSPRSRRPSFALSSASPRPTTDSPTTSTTWAAACWRGTCCRGPQPCLPTTRGRLTLPWSATPGASVGSTGWSVRRHSSRDGSLTSAATPTGSRDRSVRTTQRSNARSTWSAGGRTRTAPRFCASSKITAGPARG